VWRFLSLFLLMLMVFFMFAKWWKFTTKKISYINNINIFKFSKKRIRFIMISKILLKNFQINLILELFMCLMLELLKFLLVFYSLGVTFFFVICDFNFFDNVLCCLHFFLNSHFFFHFFPKKNCQVRKIWIQKKNVGCEGGG
jgi:hypothetical protein